MSATIRAIPLHAETIQTDRAGGVRAAAIAVRWEIAATALLACPGAAILNGEAARLVACALVWRVEGGAAWAELALELSGGERHTIVLATATPVERGMYDGVETVDGPGLMLAWRVGEAGPELLFARTGLLSERLGLPGGVFDGPWWLGSPPGP